MSAPTGDAKFQVLVVEEYTAMATFITTGLTDAGMGCYHVADAAAGMQQFGQRHPHLVVLGLGLPKVGGAAICSQIRAQSTVPIVIASVRTRREDHLHALNIGADDFVIMKPADQQMFVARVLTLMRRVYRYDKPEVVPAAVATPALEAPRGPAPTGWVTCDACGYIGPSSRFKKIDILGNHKMVCPHCEQDQHIKFTVA